MHDLRTIYKKVKRIVKEVLKQYLVEGENLKDYRNAPKMSDIEIISLALTAECLGIDSENLLWSKLKTDYVELFPNLIHRTRFNARRKRLEDFIIGVAYLLAEKMEPKIEVAIIDSMPIQVCHKSRERSSKVCRKPTDEIQADKSKNISMGGWFIGYKVHLIISESGVFQECMVSSASVHDNQFLKHVRETHLQDCTLIGDRGYINKSIQLELFAEKNIELNVPYRKNQIDFRKYPYELKIKRKRIETSFAQYCDEFNMKRNYAKSFSGFHSRIYSKIAAMTFKQFINFENQKPISQTKHALAA